MTTEEYRRMEQDAIDDLYRLRALGIDGERIVFVMSRDVYLASLAEPNKVFRAADYSDDGTQVGIRSVYQGYDIYIINEETRSTFQPAIKKFYSDDSVLYAQLSLGDFILSEISSGDITICSKSSDEPLIFTETEMTVRQEHESIAHGRVTFADRIFAARSEWHPIPPELQPEWFHTPLKRAPWGSIPLKGTPPEKDWDEKLTPEDTKELDEFLCSLVKGGILESAT